VYKLYRVFKLNTGSAASVCVLCVCNCVRVYKDDNEEMYVGQFTQQTARVHIKELVQT